MGLMSLLFPRRGRTVVRHYSAESAKEKHESDATVSFWIFVVISLVLSGFTHHYYTVYNDLHNSLNDIIIREPGLTPTPSYTGSVVHIAAPANTIKPHKAVSDEDFNVHLYGPFSLEREVEYCQWFEHESTTTTKHSDGSETTTTTYYYTKGWRSSHVSSILFDQPAAHHNPLRDPYPSKTYADVTDVSVGDGYVIDKNLAKHVSVGYEPVVRWNSSIYESFLKSPAHLVDNFYYTNKDGWFYSPYTPSVAETLAKSALQYAEGTLFDYQFADLFSECTAGDIRVRFRSKTPENGVSLIGRQVDDAGKISTFKSIDDRDVDLIYEGIHSADKLKDMKVGDAFSTFVWFLIGSMVSWAITGFLFSVKNKNEENGEKKKNY